MSTIAAKLYHDGRVVRDIDLAEVIPQLEKPNDFIWIGLHGTDDGALKKIQDHFGLHPLAVEDALDPRHLPKMDIYGDHLFLVIRTLHLDQDQIVYGNTAIFVGRQFVITVRHGSNRAHSPLRAQLEATPWLLKHGSDYVLHAIINFVVDGYFPIIDSLEEEILAIEDRAFDMFLTRPETARLFNRRRALFRLQRILGPMEDVVGQILNLNLPQINIESHPYFRDLLDHIRRVQYRVAGLRDTLTSVIETSGLLEQQRQGVITRQLAAWAAILAVPTAIAGIYGMNFDFMPETHWKHGYFVVVGAMAAICLSLYVRFKRAGWL